MDIEQLTKVQTVLLTLLVSFVTSIATGIVTVSLMEQGITPVTQTINRVVERTKEVVVQEPADPVVVTEEKTVVVREADLIATAVKKNAQSTAAVYTVNKTPLATSDQSSVGTSTTATQPASAVVAGDGIAVSGEGVEERLAFVARGVLLDAGMLVTDASVVTEGERYKVIFNDGAASYATPIALSGGLALLALEDETIGVPAHVAMSDTGLVRGKTVVALSGTGRIRIVTAVIADMVASESGVDALEIDAGGVSLGSTLIDTDGNVIGISAGPVREKGSTWFVGVHTLQTLAAEHTN